MLRCVKITKNKEDQSLVYLLAQVQEGKWDKCKAITSRIIRARGQNAIKLMTWEIATKIELDVIHYFKGSKEHFNVPAAGVGGKADFEEFR